MVLLIHITASFDERNGTMYLSHTRNYLIMLKKILSSNCLFYICNGTLIDLILTVFFFFFFNRIIKRICLKL